MLEYLGAEADEFKFSQWERKSMHTDVSAVWYQRQMSLIMLMSPQLDQLILFPVRIMTYDMPSSADTLIMLGDSECLVFCMASCVEVNILWPKIENDTSQNILECD